VPARVGVDFRAVEPDRAHVQHTHLARQQQHLNEQPLESLAATKHPMLLSSVKSDGLLGGTLKSADSAAMCTIIIETIRKVVISAGNTGPTSVADEQ
jgi:hypothetical protein